MAFLRSLCLVNDVLIFYSDKKNRHNSPINPPYKPAIN